MTMAYCFSCGAGKGSPVVSCGSCGKAPRSEAELVRSLVLSDELSTRGQLAHFLSELKSNGKLTAPDSLMAKAQEVARGPKYQRIFAVASKNAPPTRPTEQQEAASASPPISRRSLGVLTSSALHQSPFYVLGVSIRDNRKRIVEAAEEKSLELDHDLCQKSRSDLTNPRTRLGMEVAWLPGVSPRKASQVMATLSSHPFALREESGLPTLAHLNIMAAAFEAVDEEHNTDELAQFIIEAACLADDLTPEEVLRDINEDRAVSGFPEVRALDQIEAELTERKRHYRLAIKGALNKLSPLSLIQVMTEAVDGATFGGEDHAPELIDDLVDSYEVETQGVLQKETENIHKLIGAARDSAASGEAAVKPFVDKLDTVVRNWDKIAQPIQLSSKARGIVHGPSRDLALAIRGLAIELFNEYDMLHQSQRITGLIQDVFAEVPDVFERAEEDSEALADIKLRRAESALIDPIRSLVEAVIKQVERNPSGAYGEAERLLHEGASLLRAAPIKSTSPTYAEAQNLLAAGILKCAIAYGNQTSKWAPCMSLLQRALQLASDPGLQKRLKDNLAIVQGNLDSLGDLEPIQSAPSLYTMNGIGVTLYGSTDPKPDGSYMATYYFVFLAIPIFPISRYRVIPTRDGYRFLGKGPLRTFDYWHIVVSGGALLLLIASL